MMRVRRIPESVDRLPIQGKILIDAALEQVVERLSFVVTLMIILRAALTFKVVQKL
jgi:hypothetical protein